MTTFPDWGNVHALNCNVTKERQELWDEFCSTLHTKRDKQYLVGAIIEYTAGGDQEVECCTCNVHNRKVRPLPPDYPPESHLLTEHLPSLAKEAFALALHIENFANKYRYQNGSEPGYISPDDLKKTSFALYALIDLWDRG